MVRGNGQRGVVTQQADDIQVGQARLHHHDVGPLRLIEASLPQGLTVIAWVLLVRLLVGGNDATTLACTEVEGPFSGVQWNRRIYYDVTLWRAPRLIGAGDQGEKLLGKHNQHTMNEMRIQLFAKSRFPFQTWRPNLIML